MPAARVPSYREQKRSDKPSIGFVQVPGSNQRVYFPGEYGSPESRQGYDRWLTEWLVAGRVHAAPVPTGDLSINELIALYRERVLDPKHLKPDGSYTWHGTIARESLRILRDMYGLSPVSEFGPKRLKVLRELMLKGDPTAQRPPDKNGKPLPLGRKPWSVGTANEHVAMIRTVFAWAVEEEIGGKAMVNVAHALAQVKPLRSVRSPVLPVPDEHVNAVRGKVPGPIRALIDLQLLTGARPGELLGLTRATIDTTGAPWKVRLDEHKTAHHGHERMLRFGPKAQTLLMEFMLSKGTNEPLFSPKDAIRERSATKPTHRREDQADNPRKTDRVVRDAYDTDSYRRVIQRVCGNLGIPAWHPHQLRHNFATRIRAEHGIDTAKTILGHSTLEATLIYAERDDAKADQVMAKVG